MKRKSDTARKETDELLDELEKKIKKEYKTATQEMTEKAEKYLSQFKKEDESMLSKVNSGELTESEYLKWRASKMASGKRYTEMLDVLAKDAVNADKLAMGMVSDSMLNTFMINSNYAVNEIGGGDLKIRSSFTLYDKGAVSNLLKNNPDLLPRPKVDISKDMLWNKQKMSSAITQGILQGDSIPKIAKRLQSVTNMGSASAIRNARTMTTRAENSGKMYTYKQAEKMGIHGKKMWMSTHDERTRESHVEMDGETVDLDERFSNGLMEPGDPDGDPEEVYNCRCRIVFVRDNSTFDEEYNDKWEDWNENRLEEMNEEPEQVYVDFGNVTAILGDNTNNAIEFSERMNQEDLSKFNEIFSEAEFSRSESGSHYNPYTNTIEIDSENAEGSTLFHESTHWLDYNQNYTLEDDYGHVKYNVNEEGELISKEWIPNVVTIDENAGFSEYIAWEWDKSKIDVDSFASVESGSSKDLKNFVNIIGTSDTYGYERSAKDLDNDLNAVKTYLSSKGISRSDQDFVHLSDFMSAISYDATLGSLTTGGHDYSYWTRGSQYRVSEITASYNVLKSLGREDMLNVERELAPNLMSLIEKEWAKVWKRR